MKALIRTTVLVLTSTSVIQAATLVSQYQFAGNANDSVGGRNLTTTGSVSYGNATINGASMNTVTIAGNNDGNNPAVNYLNYAGTVGVTLNSVSVSFWANGTAMTNSFNDIVGLSSSGDGFKFETSAAGNDPITIFSSGNYSLIPAPTTPHRLGRRMESVYVYQ